MLKYADVYEAAPVVRLYTLEVLAFLAQYTNIFVCKYSRILIY